MKEIQLGNSHRKALVSDRDYAKIKRYKWTLITEGVRRKLEYAATHINGKYIRMHRLVKPGHRYLDHRDCDGLNNQRRNIRICSASQNGFNQRTQLRRKSSKFKGVDWRKRERKWHSRIKRNGVSVYLGMFDSEVDAACAYDKAAKKLFGSFARTNII